MEGELRDSWDFERETEDPREKVLPQGLLCEDLDRLPPLKDSVGV